jgi:RimJ/RimL family protein N-acetyltransferase
MDFDKIQSVIQTTLGTHNENILETPRLLLRPLKLEDAPVVSRLAGRREIADTTIAIPHPYSEPQAREWIASHARPGGANKEIVFAITLKANGQLIGAVGLRDIEKEHSQAELGFWIAVEVWGKGYGSEASAAALRYGFEELKLNRIYAHHMVRNPASGRVLEKIGMKREGLLRQRVKKWGVFEDVTLLAILREDWSERN